MQRKVLILSYYFPPCNFIGANRPKSWVENFAAYGLYPTVVTRHWSGNENLWTDYHADNDKNVEIEKHPSHTVIRLPYVQNIRSPFIRKVLKVRILSKIYHLYLNVSGQLHSEVNGRQCFRKFLFGHLKNHKYDCIIVTTPPLNLVRLGHELKETFDIPWVADFRDLWDNHLLNSGYKRSVRDKLLNIIIEWHLKRWLKNVNLCISVSQPLTEMLGKVTLSPTLAVTNGFEKNLFAEIGKTELSKFTVTLIGTLYPAQKPDVLFKGINLFLSDKKPEKVVFNFIGTAAIPSVEKIIKERLPESFIQVTGRISREKALWYTVNSHVLFYAGWTGYRGIYSTKIFEYLGSGNNILISPGDNDVIDQLIKTTRAGKIGNSELEVRDILEAWYKEWEEKGCLKYSGIKPEIQKYTRENQTRQVAEYLLEKIIK